MCVKLLEKKYLKTKPLQTCKNRGASQFWQGLNKIKHNFKWGAVFQVNNEANTLFWEDVWKGDIPLKLAFPRLYDLCGQKQCVVSDCWDGEEWIMNFGRLLSQGEASQWDELVTLLESTRLNNDRDKVV